MTPRSISEIISKLCARSSISLAISIPDGKGVSDKKLHSKQQTFSVEARVKGWARD